MDRGKLNVFTVEDSVEYNLAGINQCQVHEKIDMTFGLALRALLRQDSDVVMGVRSETRKRRALRFRLR